MHISFLVQEIQGPCSLVCKIDRKETWNFDNIDQSFVYTILKSCVAFYNQEQKLLRQQHKCPPHPQFNVVWVTELKREKIQPAYSNIDHGGRGEADVL
jgi:hypothetical protein